MDQDWPAITEYFLAQNLAVVTTVNGQGRPQAALVGISKYDGFQIVFATQEDTRKFQNLHDNPAMAVVVGLAKPATIQMDGQARILRGDERVKYETDHLKQIPGSRPFANVPGTNYILFTPGWLRYTDITQKPELVVERTF